MREKTILGIFVIALFLGTSAYAQQRYTADEIVQKMTADLNLTPEQVTAIKPVIEDNMTKRQALFNNGADRSAIKDQMMQLKQEEEQKLSQILTADQMTKLQSIKEQGHQGGRQHHMPGA